MDIEKIDVKWKVPLHHPFFEGHFPNNPILPSVALIDYCWDFIKGQVSQDLILSKVHSAKFKEIIRPGTLLSFQMEKSGQKNIWSIRVTNEDLKEVSRFKLEFDPY
jgi:3-hydroxymyristoyl/3-hydroxydecanoyl-(acyl carrier protein) dehydratase